MWESLIAESLLKPPQQSLDTVMPIWKRFIGILSHRMGCTRLPSEEFGKAVVDYMKGGKPMGKFERFNVLACQIHPQTGKRGMIAESHNKAVVQKTRWPGPSVSG